MVHMPKFPDHPYNRNADGTPEPLPEWRRQADILGISGVSGAGAGYATASTYAYFSGTAAGLAGPAYVGAITAYLVGKELYARSLYVSQPALQARLTRALWRAYAGYVRDFAEEHHEDPEPMPNDLAQPFEASLYSYPVVEPKLASARAIDQRLRAADCDVEKEVVPTLQGMLIEVQQEASFFTRNNRIGFNTDLAVRYFEAQVQRNRWYWKRPPIRDAVRTWFYVRMMMLTPVTE